MTERSPVEIVIEEENPRVLQVKETLESLFQTYDLSKYLFTRKVIIKPRSIPHSHPVLTLNTRHTESEEILSNFLHEEIHWFLSGSNKARTEEAIADLKTLIPSVPQNGPAVAKDEESTYLHLIVNWLELQADKKFLGEEKAYNLIRNSDVYTWIYKTVLDREPEIGNIIRKHQLTIE